MNVLSKNRFDVVCFNLLSLFFFLYKVPLVKLVLLANVVYCPLPSVCRSKIFIGHLGSHLHHLKAIIVDVIVYPRVYYVYITYFKYTQSVSYQFVMFSLYMFLSRACTLNTVLCMFHHVLAH